MTPLPRPVPITAAAVMLLALAGQLLAAATGFAVIALLVPRGQIPAGLTETPLLILSGFLVAFALGLVVHGIEVLRGTKADARKDGGTLVAASCGLGLITAVVTGLYALSERPPRPGPAYDLDTVLIAAGVACWVWIGTLGTAGRLLRRHARAYQLWAVTRRRSRYWKIMT